MRVNILGPLELIVDGEAQSLRPAQRRLLSLLLLGGGRTQTTGSLMARFWSDEPPASARTSLHVHVAGLRKRAPELIATVPGGYRLAANGVSADIADFDDNAAGAARAAATADWEAALGHSVGGLALWRGRPFPDIDDVPDAQPEIHRLLELRLELETLHARSLLALGRAEEIIPKLRRLIDSHPFNEHFRELLMFALYSAGRPADALRVGDETRRVLGEELGIEPSPRLRELQQRILTHDPTLGDLKPHATPHNLPVTATSFVGRRDTVAEVAGRLESHRLVTIIGGPGVGKSRLAVEVAATQLDRFLAGIWFVPLAGTRDSRSVLATIATAARLEREVGSVEEAAAILGRRPNLLILDNCEHVPESVRSFVTAMARQPGPARVLATSRSALSVPSERLVGLRPLADESVQLLVERVRGVDPSFALTDETRPDVVRLCDRLAGLPLGIELAARWIPTLGVAKTARLLESTLAPDALDAALDWSFGLLAGIDRTTLTSLATLLAPFTLDRAHLICGPDMDELIVAGSISRLVQASLVTAEPGAAGTIRYSLLTPIRDYAAARSQPDDSARLVERHAAAFRASADTLGAALRGGGQARALAEADVEIADYRGAMRYLGNRGRLGEVARMAANLEHYWYARFLCGEGRAWLAEALADDLSEVDRADALLSAGYLAWGAHDYDAADTCYLEALQLGEALGDERITADALYGRGLIHHKRRFVDGVRLLRQAADMYERIPEMTLRRGECRLFLGIHEAMRGDPGEGRRLLTEAAELLDEAGNTRQISKAQRWMAHCAWRTGDESDSRSHADRAEKLARSANDQPALAGALIEQTFVAVTWGDPAAAASRLLEAIDLIPEDDLIDLCQVLTPAMWCAAVAGETGLAADLRAFIGKVYDGAGWCTVDEVAAVARLGDDLPDAGDPADDVIGRASRFLRTQAGLTTP